MENFETELSGEIRRRKASKRAVASVVDGYYAKRREFAGEEEEMKKRLRALKENSIRDLDALLLRAKESFGKAGVKVVLAKDAKEAREAVLKVIGKDKRIVKSKSNTCKEVGVDGDGLSGGGREITETDTGDFAVEIAGEKGVHQVIPAMHLTPKQISVALERKLKRKIGDSPEEITHAIAGHLRERIIGAEVGITGANVITAIGEIVLLENEGNISLVSRVPKKHIVVAGIEKIVPALDDAMHIVKCATLWGSGREKPVYVSVISGPSSTGDIENELVTGAQGAHEVTLVLVDNGRSRLRKEHPEILYCINCGACNGLCPPYRQVLGFFGDSYPGPKGIVYAALAGKGKQNYLCTLCTSCQVSCPAGISIPESIRKIRGSLRMESDSGMIKKIREHGNPFGKWEKGKIPDKLYCC